MWKDLGIAGTVGELMDVLKNMPKDTVISAAGGDCHILTDGETVVLDEKGYSEEWNGN